MCRKAAIELSAILITAHHYVNLAKIAQRTTSVQTLLVIPEGPMINFLARRATGFLTSSHNPNEVRLFGEDQMLAALRS